MELKSITLTDFKGIVGTVTYNMHKLTRISGQNGAGKSTIADGFYWNLADKDYSLTSNPNIRPNDGRKCVPTVTLEFDIDGKPVTVTKMQKEKKNDLIENIYKVNQETLGEAKMKKALETYGFDFEKFLFLSHPDMFLRNMNEKKQRNDIRSILFEMGSVGLSDYEIACSSNDMAELAELLKDYTLNAVISTQNEKLRENRTLYGKDGEIIRANIEGMESSKSHIDRAKLEERKKELQEVIADIESRIESTDKQHEAYKKLSDGVLELKFKLSDMERKANEENEKKRREIQSQIDGFNGIKSDTESRIRYNDSEISSINRNLAHKTDEIEKCRKDWQSANDRLFNENNLVCAYCGQEYPEEKKDASRVEFESHKADELKRITERGTELKTGIEKDKAEIERIKGVKAENEKKAAELTAQLQDLQKQYDAIPQSVDISNTEEYQNLKKEIADKEKAMVAESDTDTARDNLKAELSAKRDELTKITNDIALADKDKEIDKKIEEKRKEGLKYEQEKADCEKILYQVDLLNQKKNNLLEESINQHFKIVRWRLFDFQKNGAYLDDCTPLIDGKDFNSQTNGALKILAKLDIIAGLQKFYGQYYPVFVDDFSLVTGNTADRISMDCQLIELVAKEGVKELEFEKIA